MKKKLAALIAAAVLITSMPFYAFAGDETVPASATNKVITLNGKLCYYNPAGQPDMSDGWKTASDGTYFVRSGAIVTSPVMISGTQTVTKKVKVYYNKKKKKWQTKKIKGAKTKKVKVVNKDKKIVVYCGFVKCQRSHQGAMFLVKQGFKNVYRYPGGISAWVDANNNVEGSDIK